MMAVRRAYGAVAKEARRQAILQAADVLFSQADQLPSVSQVAAAAGLAKGTLYIYFRTKEEIFAFLLLEGWSRVIDVACHALDKEALPERAVTSFIASFASALRGNGNLLRLDALGKGVLEENMSDEALLVFKTQFQQRLEAVGDLLETKLSLPRGRGRPLLIRTHAFTRGLWQSFGTLADQKSGDPSAGGKFEKELEEALTEFWRGAIQFDSPIRRVDE
jgi:AcrR family transcriptional regulator